MAEDGDRNDPQDEGGSGNEAAEYLRSVEGLRARTRLARHGHWFVLLVFGVVVLGSMPFYVTTFATAATPDCRAESGVVACSYRATSTLLTGILNPTLDRWGLGRWATVYWAVAILAGFAAVVAFYRRRARTVGVQGRIWPVVVAGVGLLGLVLVVDGTT